MDHVTRQFINLTKKFRKELYKYHEALHRDLTRLSDDLGRLNKSIDRQQHPDQETRNAEPSISIADFHTDVPIPVQNKTEKTKPERVWAAVKGTFEIAGIVAVIAYTVISFGQWGELVDATNFASRQARLSREGVKESYMANQIAIEANRPWLGYVSDEESSKPHYYHVTDKDGEFMTVRYTWKFKNGGKRPAIVKRVDTSWDVGKPCTASPEWNVFRYGNKSVPVTPKKSEALIIPDESTTTFFETRVPIEDWTKVMLLQSDFCMYSVIDYRDASYPGQMHSTQTCLAIIPIPLMDKPETKTLGLGECTNGFTKAN